MSALRLYSAAICQRFMSYVQVCEHGVSCQECCWPWIGGLGRRGYGHFHKENHKDVYAHVFMWEWKHQTLIHQRICHTCDYRRCCQPDHLWEGTQLQNVHDGIHKGHYTHIPEATIVHIRLLGDQGLSHRIISQHTHVSRGYVSNILRGLYRQVPVLD
jgi:HNH endonuclease